MDLTVDALKQLAAGVVAGFTVGGTPLNDGIIKVASENQFNPEQIKRLVEASNQIAYLHKMAEATDKTFEFEVADYDTVIGSFLTPDGINKQASSRSKSPLDIVNSQSTQMEKVANTVDSGPNFSEKEKLQMLEYQFSSGRDRLENMKIESQNIVEGLMKQAAQLRQDPEVIDKIAQFCGSDNSRFNEISRLVFGHVKEASSTETRGLNVLNVKSLHDNLMLAKQANQDIINLENTLDKCAEILSDKLGGLAKEAGMLDTAFKAVRSMAPSRLKDASKMAPSSLSSIKGKAAKAAPGLKGIAKGVGAGAGATFGALEVSQISAGSRPKNDIWKSLHS